MEVGWGCAVVEFGMWITFRSEEPAGRQRYVGMWVCGCAVVELEMWFTPGS